MASLVVVSGPNEGSYYPLGTRTVVIGRDEGATIQVTDEKVSRKHVQVRKTDKGGYVALDMKSANGTRINGRGLTTEIELVDGDELEIGASRVVFYTREFPDRESAFGHWKKAGQRGRPTIPQA
ncbi:MAG: FHA domain-containing protein [Phycisphaerales bacterium]